VQSITLTRLSSQAAGGDLKLCTEVNLTGYCAIKSYLNNECIELGSALEDHVRSVDPVGTGHKCYLFESVPASPDLIKDNAR
jgi:hypothetical protein